MPFKWYFNRGSFFRGLPLFQKVVCFLEKGSMLFGKKVVCFLEKGSMLLEKR